MNWKFPNVVCLLTGIVLFHLGIWPSASDASDLSVKLIPNPDTTEVVAGSDPVVIMAKVSGSQLRFRWILVGPGAIEGEGSQILYLVPAQIETPSAQAIVSIIISDTMGQETRAALVFTLLPNPGSKFDSVPEFIRGKQKTWDRSGFELFLAGQAMTGDTTTDSRGVIEIDHGLGFGFGVGYNFRFLPQVTLTSGITVNSVDITIEDVTKSGSIGEMYVNLDYYLLKRPFTPLLTGGIGRIVFSEQDDFIDETALAYNSGVGFRWDFDIYNKERWNVYHLFIKIFYNRKGTSIGDTEQTLWFNQIIVCLGGF